MQIKKVELYELFYDLVFVYAISNMTGLIHHLHHGVIETYSFLKFIFCFLILINTWMTKTVYINRYGVVHSVKNIIFLLTDISLLLVLANSFKIEEIEKMFIPFSISAGLLSLTLIIQYFLSLRETKDEYNKKVCLEFCIILSVRTILLLLAPLFPIKIGIVLAILGIISGFILPAFISKYMEKVPINFPHIVERISLIVIILFGEMIIGISKYFNIEELNLNSFLIFSIVTSLFFFYTIFNSMLNHHKERETAVKFIYKHYPIFIGISFITVCLDFLSQESKHIFVILLLYFSLLIFYFSIYFQSEYFKEKYSINKKLLISQVILFTIGLAVSLVFNENYNITIIMTALITNITTINFYRFYLKNKRD